MSWQRSHSRLFIVQINVLVTQLVTESQKRAVIEAFYCAFTASHNGADLRIRQAARDERPTTTRFLALGALDADAKARASVFCSIGFPVTFVNSTTSWNGPC